MATIKDVAQYSGLSIATISKYLNGGNLLDSNRALIAEAIDALDYKVNLAARSLKTKRSMVVGVLLPSYKTSFFSDICAFMEDILKEKGYSTILSSYYEDPKQEIHKIQSLIKQNVDAILLVPQYISAEDINAIKEVREHTVPLVLMDRHIPDFECDCALVDNTSATYQAVEQLVINGHRRIGLIIGPVEITTAYERMLGYKRVMEDYNIPLDESLICEGDYTIGAGYSAMNQLMDMDTPPTAVMGTNHDMTMGAITAAYERKMHIPNDISFIGYDEIQLTKVINPPITIVMQPMKQIAEKAAALLLRRMAQDYTDFPQYYRLKSELLIQQSIKKL